jgi:hypothetical protein
MNLEEDILIERFLKRTLSKKEQNIFLKKMGSDLMFRKKVEFEKQLLETLNDDDWSFIEKRNAPQIKEYTELLRSKEIQKLKNTLQSVNSDYQLTTKKKYKKWFLYASAAVIALLISISVFYPTFSSQKLYADYIITTELPSFISREDSNQNSLVKAQQFFENKEYAKSLVIFKNEKQVSEKQNATLYLYTGIAQMELNKFKDAEITFNELISSDLLDAPKGKWYKALLYLKMEQIDKSKLLLKEIIKDNTYNYKKAEGLLGELP